MDTDLTRNSRQSNTVRSFTGCWTCRLRRKKCDEAHPVCAACTALQITCYYSQEKPEWLDGGMRQQDMAARIKREIKEHANDRREGRANYTSDERPSLADGSTGDSPITHQGLSTDRAFPTDGPDVATPGIRENGIQQCPEASATGPQRGFDCTLNSKDARRSIAFGRSDTILLMFYLDYVFSSMFPFYNPSLFEGGRAWILELMISSQVVRQATLCQSSYFFSLAGGDVDHNGVWETVLKETRDLFGVLRQSLQFMASSDITEHLHGAVRIMTSILQLQRFEIAVLSFENCQAHLNAALALFRQLIDGPCTVDSEETSSRFNAIISRLGPPSWASPVQQVPSAEQSAFRFSSALLILDDILASTVLQEQPTLYEYHRSLLDAVDGAEATINLEAVIGCQNWALLQIGEISVLDAWKQRCKRAGNLDIMELVHRATAIKELLETGLTRLEDEPLDCSNYDSNLLSIFTAKAQPSASQRRLVTCVWAHAALIYLSLVVSGWQPASLDVRHHVDRIVNLLTCQMSPPALLRTMVWPFCVAGCVAEPWQEAPLRGMVEVLQPPGVFGTVDKALKIMEKVWQNRYTGDTTSIDLATFFRGHGDLVLLV